MAQETNITTENEFEYRDIKRNTSNQIISYTLPEETQKQYGVNKVKGVTIKYEVDGFNRTVGGLSNDLKNELPDLSIQIVEQKFINESNIYVNGVSIDGEGDEVEEFVDVYSGRYELTPGAPSFRTRYGWHDNSHYSGISYYNGDVRADTDDYIRFAGFKEIYWDNVVYGPPLSEGGYRITQPLIDTGRDLQINTTVGMQQGNDGDYTEINQYVRINRKRIPDNPSTELKRVGGLQSSANSQWKYPMFNLSYVLKNSDMRVNDLIEIQTQVGSRNPRNFIFGDKSVFEVVLLEPTQTSVPWASGTTTSIGVKGNSLPTTEAVSVPQGRTSS